GHRDMKAARRMLTFATLDQVMPDVDRLLLGHTTVGNWSLGQICNHLASAIRYTWEGFPLKAPWLIRKSIGPWYLRRILRNGRWPNGMKVPKKYEPRLGGDARAEAEALRAALEHLASHTGPLANHPFTGGPIPRGDWERFPLHSLRPPPRL